MTELTPEGYRIEHCRSCNAPIIWATTGKRNMPIDLEPTAEGNVELAPGSRGQTPVANVLTGPSLLDGPQHTSHFATCPDAERWRNRGSRG